ncbi:Protein kinase [Venturia nashicola]|nr:Protein kinase [Venturia nashicola]
MRFSSAITASVLALISSVFAAPIEQAEDGKTFKLQMTTNHGKGETFYLGSTGAVKDKAQAVDCTINEKTALVCGGKGLTYSAGHTFDNNPVKLTDLGMKSTGWKVDAGDIVTWTNGGTKINISTHAGQNKLFAEVCNGSGHGDKEGGINGFVPSVLKAVYV